MAIADPYDLGRFVSAQASTFDAALAELRGGRKRSHWMWFVFPQLRGLSGAGSLRALFGSPDDFKFCSSMTLFALAAGGGGPYRRALEHFCGGREDETTVRLLSSGGAERSER